MNIGISFCPRFREMNVRGSAALRLAGELVTMGTVAARNFAREGRRLVAGAFVDKHGQSDPAAGHILHDLFHCCIPCLLRSFFAVGSFGAVVLSSVRHRESSGEETTAMATPRTQIALCRDDTAVLDGMTIVMTIIQWSTRSGATAEKLRT